MVRTPCCKSEGLKKGAWTEEEDRKLIAYLQLHGEGGWRTLPDKAGLKRCGKSCRLRWANYLRPGIKRGKFSREEDDSIIKLHAIHGNKWSAIARGLEGRTDNEIKNHWNTHIKKCLIKKGIDPLSHKALFGCVTKASDYLWEKNNIHHEEKDDTNSNNKKLLRTSLSQLLNIVGNKFGKRINYSVLSNIIGSGANHTTNSITSASQCKRSADFSSTTTSMNLLTDQNMTSSTVSKSFSPLLYDNIFSGIEDITEFSTRFLSDVASRKDEDFLMFDDSCMENNFFMVTSPINEVDGSFEGIENYFG